MTHNPNQPINILLVEDSKTQALLVKHVIEKVAGMELIHTAIDGVEAMEYLRGEENISTPDLMLLDINMPRMDGFEVLAEVKADPSLKKLPIVMLTTSTEQEDIVKSYEDGAATYISKPVELTDLQHVFAHFAGYWRDAQLP